MSAMSAMLRVSPAALSGRTASTTASRRSVRMGASNPGPKPELALPGLLSTLIAGRASALQYELSTPSVATYSGGAAPSAAPAATASMPLLDFPAVEIPSIDIPAIDVPSIDPELASNPLVMGGAVALVSIPLLIKALTGGPKAQAVSAAAAFEALAETEGIVAIDIRPKADIKETGSPDLRSTKKKLVPISLTKVLKGEVVVDEEAFVTKLAKVANPESATLVFIDSLGGESPKAAKLAIGAGYKSVLFVKGGCEGPKGWKESDLPWKKPFRGLDLEALKALDITGVTKLAERLGKEYQENPTAIKGTLAVAAAGAAAFILFNEVEIILEVLGVFAAIQFLGKKLLFAEDREATLAGIKSLFKEKIAAGEAGEDFKKLAATVLPVSSAEEVQATEATESMDEVSNIEKQMDEAAVPVEALSDIEERKREVQAWVAAWKERTAVTVTA